MNTDPKGKRFTLQFWVVLALTALWLLQLLFPGAEQPSPMLFWFRVILATVGVVYLVATLWARRK